MDGFEVMIRRGPEGGVLWLDATARGQRVSLGGFCRYWTEGESFGGYSCPEHPEFGLASWQWDGERFVGGQRGPTTDAEVMEGEWVSDDEWARLLREER